MEKRSILTRDDELCDMTVDVILTVFQLGLCHLLWSVHAGEKVLIKGRETSARRFSLHIIV